MIYNSSGVIMAKTPSPSENRPRIEFTQEKRTRVTLDPPPPSKIGLLIYRVFRFQKCLVGLISRTLVVKPETGKEV